VGPGEGNDALLMDDVDRAAHDQNPI